MELVLAWPFPTKEFFFIEEIFSSVTRALASQMLLANS